MKNRIIEICELGQPKSIIHRENEPTSELIKTTDLVEELNKQLLLHNVVGNEVKFESGLTCMMCRQPKEKDGHTCCEDCAGLAF